MSYAWKLLIVAAAGGFLALEALAEPAPCPACDAPKEQTMRERIKADRERYDRDNVKTTARPWDGLYLGRVQPDKAAPVIR